MQVKKLFEQIVNIILQSERQMISKMACAIGNQAETKHMNKQFHLIEYCCWLDRWWSHHPSNQQQYKNITRVKSKVQEARRKLA